MWEGWNQISRQIARNTLKKTQYLMKPHYDLRIHENQSKKGDFIYFLDNIVLRVKTGNNPPWKRPGIISVILFPYLYKVKIKGVMFTGNHDTCNLKPCNNRKILEWLERCKQRIDNGEDIS